MTIDSSRGAAEQAASGGMARKLEQAREHHHAGRFAQAEALYREVLASEPHRHEALHLLGMLAYQMRRHAAALDLLARALQVKPDEPEYHHDHGVVLAAQGRLDEALASYREALVRAPAHADAHYNAAVVLQTQGRLDEAADAYRAALAAAPDLAEAHNNLGTILQRQGRLAEAVQSFRRATALQPRASDLQFNLGSALQAGGDLDGALAAYQEAAALGHAGACNEIGNALAARGRLEEAARSYMVALERQPDFAEAHNNLGNVLLEIGALDAASAAFRRALDLADVPVVRANFARLLRHPDLPIGDARLRELCARALQQPWARPADLAPAAAELILADARLAALAERVGRVPDAELEPEDLTLLAGDALLRALLVNAPVRDPALERLLCVLRRTLLARAEATDDADAALELHAALARQSFINEYVWPQTDEESAQVASLLERVRGALANGGPMRAACLAAVASYRPLAECVDATQLARAWPAPVAALVVQQVAEPLEEARLRASVPRSTPIEDDVSRRVQRQYEENPYPRWIGLPPGLPSPLELRLRQRFPHARLAPLARAADPEILIAGCGTGQEAIETAEENPQSRVLAIDLSAASLAYAKRKSEARGLHNVEYAQADILQLGSLARRFDVVSSVGVLHHLDDPVAGWRVLCDLLRPGGVMQIGLYSERARRDIVQAQRYVAQAGYRPTVPDIRRARQALAADPRFSAVCASRDFQSTSECRDLLFHVQEHSFTLPQIGEALERLDLTLLGFVLEPQVVRAYTQRFEDDPAATNLAHWAAFEADHPDTFLGMYVMWLQKPPAGV